MGGGGGGPAALNDGNAGGEWDRGFSSLRADVTPVYGGSGGYGGDSGGVWYTLAAGVLSLWSPAGAATVNPNRVHNGSAAATLDTGVRGAPLRAAGGDGHRHRLSESPHSPRPLRSGSSPPP